VVKLPQKKSKVNDSALRQRTLSVIKDSTTPVDIEYVRLRTEIAWGTARVILLQLLCEQAIIGVQTTKGWIFWEKPGTRAKTEHVHSLGQNLSNTVNGMTVFECVGRSGSRPDASPVEEPKLWQVKIPPVEKYVEN
jgi:hypothetical protein